VIIRDREIAGLHVRIFIPACTPAPAIVFSHGFGGSKLGYGYLGKHWAENGYVSIHPSHRDPKTVEEAMREPRYWQERTRDLSSVLDALPAEVDAARVALAGHSFGAFAALLCAGARVLIDGALHDLGDPRPRAFAALSPPGNGSRGLSDWSWPSIERPVLYVTGTEDLGPHGEGVEWRLAPFASLGSLDKTATVIDGATHETFAGGLPRHRADPVHLRAIESATLAFFRRTL
jgi:predicted dienelactone hydrolase